MAHWLLKSEPDSYGWDDLVRVGVTEWDGVRNAAAAKHLRAMTVGDTALFYHSGKDKAAVGIATITRTAKADGDVKDAIMTSHEARMECQFEESDSLKAAVVGESRGRRDKDTAVSRVYARDLGLGLT